MTVPAGTRLGPYEITGSLGAGGMGAVYQARDTRLDRTVAIKVLPAELSADAERRARFERVSDSQGTGQKIGTVGAVAGRCGRTRYRRP